MGPISHLAVVKPIRLPRSVLLRFQWQRTGHIYPPTRVAATSFQRGAELRGHCLEGWKRKEKSKDEPLIKGVLGWEAWRPALLGANTTVPKPSSNKSPPRSWRWFLSGESYIALHLGHPVQGPCLLLPWLPVEYFAGFTSQLVTFLHPGNPWYRKFIVHLTCPRLSQGLNLLTLWIFVFGKTSFRSLWRWSDTPKC